MLFPGDHYYFFYRPLRFLLLLMFDKQDWCTTATARCGGVYILLRAFTFLKYLNNVCNYFRSDFAQNIETFPSLNPFFYPIYVFFYIQINYVPPFRILHIYTNLLHFS